MSRNRKALHNIYCGKRRKITESSGITMERYWEKRSGEGDTHAPIAGVGESLSDLDRMMAETERQIKEKGKRK